MWGPYTADRTLAPFPVANARCRAIVDAGGLHFAGGSIGALVVCRGRVLRTAEPDLTAYGIAQVHRGLGAGALRVLHTVFAPAAERTLLLSLVRLENRGEELLPVEYTELWDVRGEDYACSPGGVERRGVDGLRLLGDLSVGVQSRAPETAPEHGLALDLSVVIPPGSRRELCFGYACADPEEPPGPILRAWRGEVRAALATSVRDWLERLPGASDPIRAYRALASAAASPP